MPANYPYQKFEEIGRSEHATVYRGRDASLGQDIAIKEFAEEIRRDSRRLERMFDAAEVQSQAKHDHILPILGVDPKNGWLLMELMRGSLVDQQDAVRTRPKIIHGVLSQSLKALDFLHSLQRLHGGIRPSNILYDDQGYIKLADIRGSYSTETSVASSKYQAPELFDGSLGVVGPATDLYCLGFAVYETLCGPNFERNFQFAAKPSADAETAWEHWHRSKDAFPPISQSVVEIRTDVASLLDLLLRKSVAERPATAREALDRLDSCEIEPISVVPTIQRGHAGTGTIAVSSKEFGRSTNAPPIPPELPVASSPIKQRSAEARPVIRPLGQASRRIVAAVGILLLALVIIVGAALVTPKWFTKPDAVSKVEVTIRMDPSDVEVFRGETPIKPNEDGRFLLDVGKHSLRFVKEGFESLEREIEVDDNNRSFGPFKLDSQSHQVASDAERETDDSAQALGAPDEPATDSTQDVKRSLSVNSSPAGATIIVNGDPASAQTPTELQLQPGAYEIQFELEGHEVMEPIKVEITLEGEVASVSHTFVPVAVAPEMIDIVVSLTPPNAALEYNGERFESNDGKATISHVLGQSLVIKINDMDGQEKEFQFTANELSSREFQIALELPPKPPAWKLPATLIAVEGAGIDSLTGLPLRVSVAKLDEDSATRLQLALIQPASYEPKAYSVKDGELPPSRFEIEEPYYISIHEVSNAQYKGFADERPAVAGEAWKTAWQGYDQDAATDDGLGSHPVVLVSHQSAIEFASWIGGTLPTEEQWEYAARGGNDAGFPYPWGTEPPTQENSNLRFETAPQTVATSDLPAGENAIGLSNVLGNVAEWCLDSYEAGHGERSDDPLIEGMFSIRGCSFLNTPDQSVRVTWRAPQSPEGASDVGFRVAIPVLAN